MKKVKISFVVTVPDILSNVSKEELDTYLSDVIVGSASTHTLERILEATFAEETGPGTAMTHAALRAYREQGAVIESVSNFVVEDDIP